MFSLNIRIGGCFFPALLVLGGSFGLSQTVAIGLPAEVTLEHAELTESSGVVVSQDGKWIFTHNDSGDRPRIFAFDRSGQLRAEIFVRDAKAEDWEDISAFSHQGKAYLAIGDVGDNQRRRKPVTIYIAEEPRLDINGAKSLVVPVVCELSVTFDQGATNCEALAYDPQRHALVLASKEPLRCRLFEVPLGKLQGKLQVMARHRQTIFVPLVTGGDISRDGQRFVLCNYAAGNMAYRESDGATAVWQLGEDGGVFSLPKRRQGEAICFTPDGGRLLLTSEFAPTPIFDIPVPASIVPRSK